MRMDTNGNERVHRRFNPSPDDEELGEVKRLEMLINTVFIEMLES